MIAYIEEIVYFVALKIYISMRRSLVFQFNLLNLLNVFFSLNTITLRKASLLDMRGFGLLRRARNQDFYEKVAISPKSEPLLT